MSSVKKMEPVVSVAAGKYSLTDLQVFVSIINYYENGLVIITVAHDEKEAQDLIKEMYIKAYEKDPNNPNSYVGPGTFDSWWKRSYRYAGSGEGIVPMYSINPSAPGVYIFKSPDVDNNFR